MNIAPVTLQISLAPTDLPHAKHILPHQLQQWAGQVDEVLLTLDLHQSKGRFSKGWNERLPQMRVLIDECCSQYSNVYLKEVDYSPETVAQVGSIFFDQPFVPTKDFRGGPFYSYFYGLFAAKHKYVFHMDSDMMFGGGSSTWIGEAIQLLNEKPNVLFCSPLPGPPRFDGQLKFQNPDGRYKIRKPESETHTSLAFRFSTVSSRIFLLDKQRFSSIVKKLELIQPSIFNLFKAYAKKNPPYELPEINFSRALLKKSMYRVDFLGQEPGMWSVHPVCRSNLFYENLPHIIQRIKLGEIPHIQRGDYNLSESLINVNY